MKNENDVFVGRNTYIENLLNIFTHFLDRSDNKNSLRIVSIYGNAGVGKTSLVKEVLERDPFSYNKLILKTSQQGGKNTNKKTIAKIVTDDFIDDSNIKKKYFSKTSLCRKSIQRIDNQLIKKVINNFSDKNTRKQIEHALKDLGLFGLKIMSPKMERLIKENPKLKDYAEKIIEMFKDTPSISSQLLSHMGMRRRDLRIQIDASRELTNCLYNDIEKTIVKIKEKTSLILIIDDYEALFRILDSFLISYFLKKFQKATFKCLVIIIGRDEVDYVNTWKDFERYSFPSIMLTVLEKAEAIEMLKKLGIEDNKIINDIILESGCHPLFLKNLAKAVIEGKRALYIKKTYDRVTYLMSEEEKKWLNAISFLDIPIKEETIAIMLPNEDTIRIMDWFMDEASARDGKYGFSVDEFVSKIVKLYVGLCSGIKFDEYRMLAEKAREVYDKKNKKASL